MWLIVPSPGSRRDQQRQSQLGSEVAHQVVARERHEQPTDALDDERVLRLAGRGAARRAREQASRVDRPSRELRRPDAVRRRVRSAAAPPPSGSTPAAVASSSSSRGQPPARPAPRSRSGPACRRAARRPPARIAAISAADEDALADARCRSPVTNSPRTPRRAAASGRADGVLPRSRTARWARPRILRRRATSKAPGAAGAPPLRAPHVAAPLAPAAVSRSKSNGPPPSAPGSGPRLAASRSARTSAVSISWISSSGSGAGASQLARARCRSCALPRRASAQRRAARRACARPSSSGAGATCPPATVGGRIACANTPSSIACWQSAIAARSSPTTSGTMCISPSATGKPSLGEARGAACGRWSAAGRRGAGVPASSSSAASAPATAGGPGAVEKISEPGRVDQVLDHLRARAGVRAVGAERLAQRSDHDVDLALEARGGDSAAPVGADVARGMGLVDDDPRAVDLGELGDVRQRRDVAVHREDRVRDDQPPRRGARRGGACDQSRCSMSRWR